MIIATLLGGVAPVTAQTPASPAAPDPCAATGGSPAVIEAVTPLGDLQLADGRTGRLADLDFGADAVPAARWIDHLAAIRQAIVGRSVLVDEGGSLPDRWGRRTLRISPATADGAAPASFHHTLIQSGLARVWPLDEQEACASSLLPIEAGARAQGLGLWRDPVARLLGAGEAPAILALAGRFAIVEGQVVSVGERPRRVYVNFGRDFRRDFSATLAPRAVRLLEKAGIAPSSLRGKTVRVRGVVAGREAPVIEITSMGQIEVVR